MSMNRMGRIEGEIQKIVSSIILNDLKNPEIIGMISVTSVQLSNDLKYANIYVSIFRKDNNSEKTLEQLNKAKGFIRKELGSKITMRYTPELIFKLDNSISYGAHIDEILNEIIPKKK